jgi:hypothetical protein
MTGTAETEESEFHQIYGLDVLVIPTNRAVIRHDRDDLIFRTKREKYVAIMDEIERFHRMELPVLVGTTNVEVSETLSRMLKRRGLQHHMSDYYSGSGSFVVSGTAIDDITVTPPSDFYIDDPSGLRIATKYDEDASVVGDLGVHLQKSAYDLVTNPDGTVVDMNGASLGVAMYERSGVCRAVMFKPDAILWDIRNAVQSFFLMTKQGRTAEFSGYMVYAAQGWHPENGMFVETIADSPLATG